MQTIEQSREMAKLACEALADKKGEDIRVIDIAGISVLARQKSRRCNCY